MRCSPPPTARHPGTSLEPQLFRAFQSDVRINHHFPVQQSDFFRYNEDVMGADKRSKLKVWGPQATWRDRLFFGCASLFILWHAMVMLFAAGPSCYLSSKLSPVLSPYKDLFYLSGSWEFFAEQEVFHPIHYTIHAKGRKKYKFSLTDLPHSNPRFTRKLNLYRQGFIDLTAEQAVTFRKDAAAYLCQTHKDLTPKAITFEIWTPQMLSREEYIRGERLMDGAEITRLGPYSCKKKVPNV